MKFGPVPVDEAAGTVLAHSLPVGGKRLRKGLILSSDHVADLMAAGVTDVIVARLDDGDLDEDTAAAALAAALVPDPAAVGLRLTKPVTGRVNVVADGPGVVILDVAALERFNRVHPMITVATVPAFQQMPPGGMVATIKVISYAVPQSDMARAAATAPSAIRLASPVLGTASLIFTDIPGGPDNTKAEAAMRERMTALGIDMTEVVTVRHDTGALSRAIAEAAGDLIMILTGSATSDINDVAPSAVRQAGGRVDRFGMPVDPGNLLFLGEIRGRAVVGLPGCARSPALNGADWVLSRIACGIPVTGADIAAMGVGGLLKEIRSRPQPRAAKTPRAFADPQDG